MVLKDFQQEDYLRTGLGAIEDLSGSHTREIRDWLTTRASHERHYSIDYEKKLGDGRTATLRTEVSCS